MAGSELTAAWTEFLGRFGFDVFFTVTFRNPANSPGLACDRTRKALLNFFKVRHLHAVAFIVAEQHQGGMYHAHGLLRLGALGRENAIDFLRSLWSYTFQRYGRCRFELIKNDGGVNRYVAKYLTKRISDYQLVGMEGDKVFKPPVVT